MKKDSLLYNYDEKRHYYRNFSMLSTEWEIMHLSENVIFYVIIITFELICNRKMLEKYSDRVSKKPHC